MVAQVLIHEEGIQGRRIKAGQKHPDHDQQIDLLLLYPLGQIAVVILKATAIHPEVGLEPLVIVADGGAQKLLGTAIHRRHLEALVRDFAHCVLLLIRSEGKNRRHTERFLAVLLQRLQTLIVLLCRVHTAHRKHRIEALATRLHAVRLLPVVL